MASVLKLGLPAWVDAAPETISAGAKFGKKIIMNKIWSLALATFVISASVAGAQGQPGIKRTDLQRQDLFIEERETVQARIDIAPGATTNWHRHPVTLTLFGVAKA